MLVADYNSDTLMTFLAPEEPDSSFETKKRITRIYKNDQTLAYHFSGIAPLDKGPIKLTAKKIEELNELLIQAGFKPELVYDPEAKFVIAYVDSFVKHPDSDHLHVAQVKISSDKSVQIVSGSPNLRQGIKTVACLPGAIMPSGKIIWPEKLRGVDSYGMMAAPKELGLKNAPDHPGMIVLPDDFGKVGETFDFIKGNELEFNN
ncbi:YtpR family tRNA-binding protein [Oenococcus oeni]|uniref:Hypothetical tRNA binding protein n=2 Tax=Oenococcus oeni TaxID=1247 RepID=A0NIW8_OENOE|nr:DUF4479 domain-containing protein [Oenococcus oeni]EAV39550.1 hypothetical tRNA binding protein [Oenococcus oeni ATCC BAA-1163]EJO02560.1 EMAP domain-containing protein [Oenococcus oeni AWRIB418]KDP19553.1 DSBA oxidoreductase [Oenococcus oeni]KGH62806.1 DSBA oxidoreductase [Oenococcus oeni S13]KGH65337.1 DSBA oxidoreductase [Oenococcus oeni IOEB_C23]